MGKCLASLLLTRTVDYGRTQPCLLPNSHAHTGPTRPAIEAQSMVSNLPKVRLIISGTAGVGGFLAASPPHKFSFRPNLNLGTHTVIPYPAHSHSPACRSSPASPAARVVVGFPSHSTSQLLLLTASQQASNMSSLHCAALIRPRGCRGCVNYPHAAGRDGCLPGLRGPSEP